MMTPITVRLPDTVSALTLRRLVGDELTRLIQLRGLRPTSVHATFADENGPKGGRATRCTLEVRLPRRPAVHVGATATTPRLAFDGALAKLERRLTQLRDAGRERKRRPTKYFVAAHGLTQ